MNKQIREFERQSGIEIYGLGKDRTKWEYALDKFADLILRVCATIAGGVDGKIILEYFNRDKQVVTELLVEPENRVYERPI